MKLLFDQNLSHRLCRMLADAFPAAEHVHRAGLDHATDETIWAFAREHDYAIVTLDADFADIAALHGAPPEGDLAALWQSDDVVCRASSPR